MVKWNWIYRSLGKKDIFPLFWNSNNNPITNTYNSFTIYHKSIEKESKLNEIIMEL